MNRVVSKRMANRKILCEKAPGLFKYFEYEVHLYESVEFCKTWLEDKKWLDQNGVDYKDFPEHERYKQI